MRFIEVLNRVLPVSQTAQDISYHNVQELFQALTTRSRISSDLRGSQDAQGQDASANHRAPSPQPKANGGSPDNGNLCLAFIFHVNYTALLSFLISGQDERWHINLSP